MDIVKSVKRWLIVMILIFGFFYAMDHALMGAQGLPLNWNMAPAN